MLSFVSSACPQCICMINNNNAIKLFSNKSGTVIYLLYKGMLLPGEVAFATGRWLLVHHCFEASSWSCSDVFNEGKGQSDITQPDFFRSFLTYFPHTACWKHLWYVSFGQLWLKDPRASFFLIFHAHPFGINILASEAGNWNRIPNTTVVTSNKRLPLPWTSELLLLSSFSSNVKHVSVPASTWNLLLRQNLVPPLVQFLNNRSFQEGISTGIIEFITKFNTNCQPFLSVEKGSDWEHRYNTLNSWCIFDILLMLPSVVSSLSNVALISCSWQQLFSLNQVQFLSPGWAFGALLLKNEQNDWFLFVTVIISAPRMLKRQNKSPQKDLTFTVAILKQHCLSRL